MSGKRQSKKSQRRQSQIGRPKRPAKEVTFPEAAMVRRTASGTGEPSSREELGAGRETAEHPATKTGKTREIATSPDMTIDNAKPAAPASAEILTPAEVRDMAGTAPARPVRSIRHGITTVLAVLVHHKTSAIVGFLSLILTLWVMFSDFRRAGILFELFGVGLSDAGIVYESKATALDLRYWTDVFTVTGNSNAEPISTTEVGIQTTRVIARRTSSAATIAYFRVGTGGDAPAISCLSHPYRVAQARRLSFGRSGSSWYLLVDISEMPLEVSFVTLYQVIYKKGFQGNSQFTTIQCEHDYRGLSLEVSYPRSKLPKSAVETKSYLRDQNPQRLIAHPAELKWSEDKSRVLWTITDPTKGRNYTLSWQW